MSVDIQEMNSADRRRYVRHNLSYPLAVADAAGQVLDQNPLLRDVSFGGFGFITTSPIEPGMSFRFNLEFPRRKQISGIAKTCWVKSHKDVAFNACGAQIVSLRWGQKRILRNHLEPRRDILKSADLIDILLISACCLIYFQVLRELGIFDFKTPGGSFASAFGFLPIGAIVLSALVLVVGLLI